MAVEVRMEFGEREAQDFLEAQSASSVGKEWQLQASKVTLGAAPELWNRLVTSATNATKAYVIRVKQADGLGAELLNENNLTIQKESFPKVKLEIIRTPLAIKSSLFTMCASLANSKTEDLPVFRFGVDSQMQPCFTDYERELSPQQVAHELLKQIFEMFRKLYT